MPLNSVIASLASCCTFAAADGGQECFAALPPDTAGLRSLPASLHFVQLILVMTELVVEPVRKVDRMSGDITVLGLVVEADNMGVAGCMMVSISFAAVVD
jgi:hypothetical protein